MPVPERINATTASDYLEVMTQAVFQAGMSWATVQDKWPSFRRAFKQFDCAAVAAFTQADIARLSQDKSIVRSPGKIQATVENARTILRLEQEHGRFESYLRSFGSFEELSKDMRKQFRFMGELSVYYFLFRVRQPVPPFDQWVQTIPGKHPRMQEMVELAFRQEAKDQLRK